MLYHYSGDTFKFVKDGNNIKVYCKATSRWSTGWTYVGSANTEDRATNLARRYAT